MNKLITSTSLFASSLNTIEFILGGAKQTKGNAVFDNSDLDSDIDVSFGVRGMFEVYENIGVEFSYQDFGEVENTGAIDWQ